MNLSYPSLSGHLFRTITSTLEISAFEETLVESIAPMLRGNR